MKARAAAVAVVAALAVSSGRASGQTPQDDYDVYSDKWNGMSTFKQLVEGSGLRVVQTESLDWEEIERRGDILFLLYPTNAVEPSHVAAFIRGGGRVLVGDDFGKGENVLTRLGMLRESGVGVDATRFHRDLAFAPMARPWMPNHPLATDVDELATNHPAILPSADRADVVFGFGTGEAVVATADYGNGRYVATSDPSIFINRMLQFEGNFQFTINLLRYLSTPQTTRVIVLAGDFTLHGRPEDAPDDASDSDLGSILKDFNLWLDELNEYLLTKTSLRVLAAAFALIVALIAAASLPLSRKTRLDGTWIRAGTATVSLDSFEAVLGWFDTDDARRNFALPAAVLRDAVNTALSHVLEHSDPLYGMTETDLMAAIEETRGREAMIDLRVIYATLLALPTREQAASGMATANVTRRDFERLHAGAERLYRSLSGPED